SLGEKVSTLHQHGFVRKAQKEEQVGLHLIDCFNPGVGIHIPVKNKRRRDCNKFMAPFLKSSVSIFTFHLSHLTHIRPPLPRCHMFRVRNPSTRVLSLFLLLFFPLCAIKAQGLKDLFSDFQMGTALSTKDVNQGSPEVLKVLSTHFSSI